MNVDLNEQVSTLLDDTELFFNTNRPHVPNDTPDFSYTQYQRYVNSFPTISEKTHDQIHNTALRPSASIRVEPLPDSVALHELRGDNWKHGYGEQTPSQTSKAPRYKQLNEQEKIQKLNKFYKELHYKNTSMKDLIQRYQYILSESPTLTPTRAVHNVANVLAFQVKAMSETGNDAAVRPLSRLREITEKITKAVRKLDE